MGRTIDVASAAALLVLLEAGCGARSALEPAGANPFPEDDGPGNTPCESGLDDPHNCGACGHDCLGGACVAGACQPVDIASGQSLPAGIVVDETNVYWVNLGTATTPGEGNNSFQGGSVMQCSVRDCSRPLALVTGLSQQWGNGQPFAIAAGSRRVYFYAVADDFAPLALQACAIGGCGGVPSTLGMAPPSLLPYGLVAAAGEIVWGTGPIEACSASLGCAASTKPPVTTLGGGFPVHAALATDGRDVYWGVEPGGIVRCALGGCRETPTPVCSEPAGVLSGNPIGLALDAANVYWTDDQGGVWKCSRKQTNDVANALATGRHQALAIATDGIDVYWTEGGSFPIEVQYNQPGRVSKCPVSGCGGLPTTVASDPDVPMGIAIDATSVYWTSFSGGRITRWVK